MFYISVGLAQLKIQTGRKQKLDYWQQFRYCANTILWQKKNFLFLNCSLCNKLCNINKLCRVGEVAFVSWIFVLSSSLKVLLWPLRAAVTLGCYISRLFCQGEFKPLVGLQTASPAEKLETELSSEMVTFSYIHKCLSTLRCHFRKSHIPKCFEMMLLKWQGESDRRESRLKSGTREARNGHVWMTGWSSLWWKRWVI